MRGKGSEREGYEQRRDRERETERDRQRRELGGKERQAVRDNIGSIALVIKECTYFKLSTFNSLHQHKTKIKISVR